MTPDERRAQERLENAAAVCFALAVTLVPVAWLFWLGAALAPGEQPTLRDTGWVLLVGAVFAAILGVVFVFAAIAHDDDEEDS